MNRILAIVERDMRKFMRSPTLIVVSMFLPLVQLVVLGYAFGGKIRELRVGIVDQDRGIPTVKLREMFGAMAANVRTFTTVDYTDLTKANTDLREGRITRSSTSRLSSPAFSGAGRAQVASLKTTQIISPSGPGRSLLDLLGAYNQRGLSPRVPSGITLSVVELYPYVPTFNTACPARLSWRFIFRR